MRKPNESLDDYIMRPAPKVASQPPPPVSLRRTGNFEVLKPLTRQESYARSPQTAFKAFRPAVQPLWFRRFLAVGSGALVLIALGLVSAILVGINDPPVGPEIATNQNPGDTLMQTVELFTLDVSQSETSEPAIAGSSVVRSNVRRRPTRRIVHVVAHKARRQLLRLPEPGHPKFVPTTLVIYAENGVINTRIEPWLQHGNKRTLTFNN